MYTLPIKLPQIAIGFQHGRNVLQHTMPTMFNELYTLEIVQLKIVTIFRGTIQNACSNDDHKQLEQGLDE